MCSGQTFAEAKFVILCAQGGKRGGGGVNNKNFAVIANPSRSQTLHNESIYNHSQVFYGNNLKA